MLEYWSLVFRKGCGLVLFYHHSITPVLPRFIGFLLRSPDLIEYRRGLFLDHKMHPPVLGAGGFGPAAIDRALLAEADRDEPFPGDALTD